ncbi:MAG: amidohydrolase family protein [Steroidobacteraceae bacterium]
MSSLLLVSADAHCLEPEDLWTSRLSKPEWVERAPQTRRLPNDLKDMRFDGKRFNLSIDYRRYEDPGQIVDGVWQASPQDSKYTPIPYDSLSGRIADLNIDGVWAETIHPNNGQLILGSDDADFAMACARIYNDYIAEHMASERSFPNAIIPVCDIKASVREIDRIVGLGLRGIEIPMLAPPNAPYFLDLYAPLWAAAAANQLVVSMHVGSGQLREGNLLMGGLRSGGPSMSGLSADEKARVDAFGKLSGNVTINAYLLTSVGGTISELLAAGVCERHPNLHFLFVETGAAWLALLMQSLDASWDVGIGSREVVRESEVAKLGGSALPPAAKWTQPLRPSEYLARQMHVTFMEDHQALANRHISGIDALVWGNDYPHYEGSWPKSRDAIQHMSTRAGLTAQEQAAIFGGTIAKLYGMKLPG